MAKKTQQPPQDPESATTQVNIADFQRTRDSVRGIDFAHRLFCLSLTHFHHHQRVSPAP
jgi:hypothetical protein